ncbi:MAG: hypothetical protein GX298_07035, partial [Planctomycetes bacterium]|nr:hypothetical protein [Planctomycetota bacterium]
MKKLLLCAMAAALVVPAMAGVTGLYNTGVDDNGIPLAADVADPHYTLFSPEGLTAYAITKHNAWVSPGSDAMWIGPTASSVTDAEGWYVYRLTFDIAVDPANVIINGKWATDNSGEIWLNGTETGVTRLGERGFEDLSDFTLLEGFASGENTLEFKVYNYPGTSGNPTGLLVTDLSVTIVPAPGAILLAGIGTS